MNGIKYLVILMFIGSFCNAQKQTNPYTSKVPSANGTGKVYMGREIALVMDFSGVDWLERNTRSKEENTNLTIAKLPLLENSVVADIGAGSGFYTFRIADKIPKGKVYAVEIQDDAIVYLKNKATQKGVKNVVVVKGTDKNANLPEGTVDLALMVDVYHELLYPQEVLQSIKKSLKPGGKLLLIEYKGEDPEVNIKEEHKMTVKQVQKELGANGFKLIQNGQFLPIQHFLLFEKEK